MNSQVTTCPWWQWSAAESAVVGHLVKSDTSPTRPGGCGGNPDFINSSVVLVKWSGTRWSSNHPPIDAVALSCTSRIWSDNQTSHSAWPSSLRHQSVSSHLHHSDTSTIFWITLHYRTCGMQVLSINKFSMTTLLSHPKTVTPTLLIIWDPKMNTVVSVINCN